MKKYWIIIALVIVGYSITHAQTNNGLIYKEIDDDFQTYCSSTLFISLSIFSICSSKSCLYEISQF